MKKLRTRVLLTPGTWYLISSDSTNSSRLVSAPGFGLNRCVQEEAAKRWQLGRCRGPIRQSPKRKPVPQIRSTTRMQRRIPTLDLVGTPKKYSGTAPSL